MVAPIVRVGFTVVRGVVKLGTAAAKFGVKVSVEMKGVDKTLDRLEAYRRRMRAEVEQALEESAILVQNEARRLVLQGPKTGRVYVRRRSIAHRASAPGQPPASDTGTLVRNIVVKEVDRVNVTATVAAKTKYAGYLEDGTRKMEARPFLNRALQNKKREIEAIFAARLRRRR